MIKACVILIFFGFLISSCSLSEGNKSVPDNAQYESGVTQDSSISNSGADTIVAEMPNNSPVIGSFEMKIPTIESIKKVTTIQELKMLNPMLIDPIGANEQQFIELQKYRMIFGILLTQIKDPEFLKIRTDKSNMILGKEIWPQDLKNVDKEFEDIILQSSFSGGNSNIINNVSKRRMDTMAEFQSSQKYKDYIELNQQKLHSMDAAMKKFWLPEMLEIDKKIQDLEKTK